MIFRSGSVDDADHHRRFEGTTGIPRCRNGHGFSSKSKRNEVNCGRDIAILHEENKKCWLPGLIPGWLAKNKFI
ncbi:hypothetical protein DQ142_16930 [Escherichia coli]|nr:hypothetical protein [Escherichia coli]